MSAFRPPKTHCRVRRMYEADISQIVISGNWELRVDALIDDFTKVIYRTEVPIQ